MPGLFENQEKGFMNARLGLSQMNCITSSAPSVLKGRKGVQNTERDARDALQCYMCLLYSHF